MAQINMEKTGAFKTVHNRSFWEILKTETQLIKAVGKLADSSCIIAVVLKVTYSIYIYLIQLITSVFITFLLSYINF